ncbi:MAG: tRNA (5-methylaminomethyl-2-thiouridine)(34)-methyltransferase MnmD, partial [Alphaproteobacteria bacterium]|nr:tRNA (5-methylaminomethyl-2-thiouridine)(34)-methyltransferase MnmD [Alphaproteobacteria bacterium]
MSSPHSTMFDDIYFSPDDGPAETNHVFLQGNNLPARWAGRDVFTVAELGFGTGLNFLLTAKLFMENNSHEGWLDYVAVEKYPLTAAAIDAALRPFGDDLPLALFDEFLAAYPPLIPGYHRINLGGRVRLTLLFDDVMKALPGLRVPRGVDAWFLDGFAPAKN